MAVSTGPDPTGTYYRYFFSLSTTVFYDFPKSKPKSTTLKPPTATGTRPLTPTNSPEASGGRLTHIRHPKRHNKHTTVGIWRDILFCIQQTRVH